MSDTSSVTYSILLGEIRAIKNNKNNHAVAMQTFATSIDVLYARGDAAVTELIDLLKSNDVELAVLSMLCLGILNQAGLNATKAINPIVSVVNAGSPKMIKFISFASLAMLGNSDGIQMRTEDMARRKINSTRDWNGSIASTIVDYIAGVSTW